MSRPASSQEKLNSQESGRQSRQREASEKQKAREHSHDSGQDDANEPIKPNIIEDQPSRSPQNLDLVENTQIAQDDNAVNAEDNSPSKPNIPKEKAQPQSPVAKPKPKQTKVDKTQKNRPVIDKKTTKPKKGDVYSRGATDSKKSAKIISKSPADPKQVASNGSKEQIHEAEDQENMDPEDAEMKSHLDSKNNESAKKENFEPIGQNINDDMHSTFLHNNEQIIADLANLEIEQEKQIFQIVFDTFINDHGLTDLENLTILGKALGQEENAVEDM